MTTRPPALLALLTLLLWGCAPTSPPSDAAPPSPNAPDTPEASPAQAEEGRFLATYTEPCGRSLLEVQATPDAPPVEVSPRGQHHPIARLKRDMLIHGRFIVYGRFVPQAISDDHHCGAYPVFEVTRFEPWGPIQRCTSIGAMEMHRYTEPLPTDRYVPEDYEDGPEGLLLDADACTRLEPGASCAPPRVQQTGCDLETVWCCPTLSAP